MRKDHVQYAIIGAGLVALIAWGLMYLVPHGGERPLTVDACRRMLTQGTTPQERAAGAAGLGALRDLDSVPLLLTAMEAPETVVRGRAGVAVRSILGADFFFKAEDPPEKRAASIARYRGLFDMWQKKRAEQDESSGKD